MSASHTFDMPERRDLSSDGPAEFVAQCFRCRANDVWFSTQATDSEAMQCSGPCEKYFCETCQSEDETYLGICRDCVASVLAKERLDYIKLASKAEAYAAALREIRDIDPKGLAGEVTVFSALAGLSIAIAKAKMALLANGGA